MSNGKCQMTNGADDVGFLRLFPLSELSSVMAVVEPISNHAVVTVGGDLLVEALGLEGWRIEAVEWDGENGMLMLQTARPGEENAK